MKTLKLTRNARQTTSDSDDSTDRARFVCPLNMKEMNGSQPFVYLWICGCVFSQAGLRAVSNSPPPKEDVGKLDEKGEKARGETDPPAQLDLCPQCGAKYNRSEDTILLNSPLEEQNNMVIAMMRRRASEPPKKGKKRKVTASTPDEPEPPAKKKLASPVPPINVNIATASRAVAHSLAQEEAKRKANMSEAVKSLYGPKDGVKKKETFMTMGTFTRVSHVSSGILL